MYPPKYEGEIMSGDTLDEIIMNLQKEYSQTWRVNYNSDMK